MMFLRVTGMIAVVACLGVAAPAEESRSPLAVAVSPDGKTLYVSDKTALCVAVLDVAAGKMVREVPIAGEPHGLALSADGKTLYVAERKADIPLALGSSIAAGPEPFMPQVAVACLQTAKALKVHAIPRGSYAPPRPAEGWWLLTGGGAEALDMGDRVGALEPGYEADCLVVRPEPWIADLPAEQQVSALLYTLRPQQIEHVYVAGRRVGP